MDVANGTGIRIWLRDTLKWGLHGDNTVAFPWRGNLDLCATGAIADSHEGTTRCLSEVFMHRDRYGRNFFNGHCTCIRCGYIHHFLQITEIVKSQMLSSASESCVPFELTRRDAIGVEKKRRLTEKSSQSRLQLKIEMVTWSLISSPSPAPIIASVMCSRNEVIPANPPVESWSGPGPSSSRKALLPEFPRSPLPTGLCVSRFPCM